MARRTNNLLLFTNQFTVFAFIPRGQSGVIPPTGGDEQYLISSMGLSEIFVTDNRLSAIDVSYTLNPLSRRTN